jgi:hypothetical protein
LFSFSILPHGWGHTLVDNSFIRNMIRHRFYFILDPILTSVYTPTVECCRSSWFQDMWVLHILKDFLVHFVSVQFNILVYFLTERNRKRGLVRCLGEKEQTD